MADTQQPDTACHDDTAAARQFTLELLSRQATALAWVGPVIGLMLTGLFALTMLIVLFRGIAPESQAVVLFMLGALQAMAGLVVGYYYGSTQSNRRRDDRQTMERIAGVPNA